MKKLSLLVICFLVISVLGCSYFSPEPERLNYKYKINYNSYIVGKDYKMPYFKFIFYANDYKINNNELIIIGKHLKARSEGEREYEILKVDEKWKLGRWTKKEVRTSDGIHFKEEVIDRFRADVEIVKLGSL